MRKFLLTAMAVILLVGATSLPAQLSGTWEGTGEGWCPYPILYPGDYMKPWQEWKGRLEDDGTFRGDWYDAASDHGIFNGIVIFETPDGLYCEGEWYWLDERVDPPVEYLMGPFSMKFKWDGLYCYGEWQAYSFANSGTMKGDWIEP